MNRVPLTVWEKIKAMFKSRKFWALCAALVAILSGYLTENISVWQSVQALIAALAVYSTGVAIEDAGAGK